MQDATQRAGQRAAAEYLRHLLLKPGPYRDAWRCRVSRPRDDVINQLAVAEVIAGQQHAVREGQLTPYQLRDIVSGALFGGKLTADTLQTFIAAFGFAEEESDRLLRLLSGSTRISVMSGTRAVPASAEMDVDVAYGPRKHQTLALHDHVWVGADGRIDRARTMQVIEAIAPAVDRVPAIFDINVLTLEAGQGCKELLGQVRRVGSDMFFTEILLARTLDIGETLSFEYLRTYRYAGHLAPSEREHRRAVMRHADGLDMRVEFHPERLPCTVWWSHWDGTDGDVLEREAVSLDSQHSVHRYLRALEKTVVGFYWEWGSDDHDD